MKKIMILIFSLLIINSIFAIDMLSVRENYLPAFQRLNNYIHRLDLTQNNLRSAQTIKIEMQYFNSDSSDWEDSRLLIAEYNSSGNLIRVTDYADYYDDEEDESFLLPVHRIVYHYDTNNLLLRAVFQIGYYDEIYHPDNVEWFNLSQTLSEYLNGKITKTSTEFYFGTREEPESLEFSSTHFIYSQFDMVQNIIHREYNMFDDSWEYGMDYVSYFNNKISEVLYLSSPDSLDWVTEGKVLFNYRQNDTSTYQDFQNLFNSFGFDMAYYSYFFKNIMLETIEDLYFDEDEGDFFVEDRIYFSYNSANQILEERETYYDPFDDEWYFYEKYSYQYTNGMLSEMRYYYYTEDEASERLLFTDITSISDNIISPVNITLNSYPNPFKDNLSINMKLTDLSPVKIELFNVKGQKIKSFNIEKPANKNLDLNLNNKLNLEDMSSGIYFIKVSNDNFSTTQKVLKIK